MAIVDDVVARIDLQPREIRRGRSWFALVNAVCWLLGSIGTIVALVYAVTGIAAAWSDGLWDDHLWSHMFDRMLIPMVGGLQGLTAMFRFSTAFSGAEMGGAALALREAAGRGDVSLAPVSPNLDGLSAEPPPALPARLGPFRRPNAARASDKTVLGVSLLVLGGLASVVVWLIVAFAAAPLPLALIAALAALTSALLALGCWVVFRARSLRRSFWIDVDEYGLRWSRPGGSPARQRLHWGDVCSFFIASFGSGSVTPRYALVFDGGDDILAIEVRLRGGERELQAAQALARLTFARTRLPLRDVTPTLGKLGPAPWRNEYKAVYDIFTSTVSGRAPLWPDMPRPMSFRRALRPLFIAVLLSALIFPVTWGIGWIAQGAQAQQYNDLLRRVHSQKPLYHDSLTAPDGDWSAQYMGDDPQAGTFVFESGSFQLRPNRDEVSMRAVTPFVYKDVVVEVTVRQHGGPDYVGAGLVLHTDANGLGGVEFTISASGMWEVSHYGVPVESASQITQFSFQGSDFVNKRDGAPNRVTIIMHGSRYLCYVNGHFLGAYQDPFATPGHVGVHNDSVGGLIAVFNDFATYPV